MSEAVFPLVGAAFVMLFVLPSSALLAKGVLVALERRAPMGHLGIRYLIMTGSSILPLAWFLSAGLHQVESSELVLACLLDHHTAELCFEPGFFVLTLGFIVTMCGLRALPPSHQPQRLSPSDEHAIASRIARVLQLRPELDGLQGRIDVSADADLTIETYGYRKPRIRLGMHFASRLSDPMLAAALAHESEHARALDPLRYILLRVAVAGNPLGGFLIQPHAVRWHIARETQCDREAVIRGAAPLSLAEAIVHAARPCTPVVALGTSNVNVLRLRTGMLIAFAEHKPTRRGRIPSSAVFVGAMLLLFTLLLPHQAGTAALDVLHTTAEQALTYFWR
ncbi:MAG TPA: hypothetical protein VHO25_16710 [Polyangiaceae bacterium]|nr:hypothetical protein [Polyangiaceae bacterium]